MPVMWDGAADTAVALTLPFVNFGGQALATDGAQVVGYGTAQNRDGTTFGPAQAVVWDANSGTAVNLGDGGNPSIAYGVGDGVQVGDVVIIISYALMTPDEAKNFRPIAIFPDENNRLVRNNGA